MKIQDLPKATSIDMIKGRLLYCEDGIILKQLPASLLASQDNNNDEEEDSD